MGGLWNDAVRPLSTVVLVEIVRQRPVHYNQSILLIALRICLCVCVCVNAYSSKTTTNFGPKFGIDVHLSTADVLRKVL